MLVDEAVEARNVNGILGLLCREHYPGLVWTSEDEDPEVPTSFDHYALVADAPDVNGRQFRNLADRVIMELWVSLSRTTALHSSHSLDIVLETNNGYLVSLCRTSSDASRDRRKGRIRWLTLPVKGVSRTCITRPASRRTLTTTPTSVTEESTKLRQEERRRR
jgi:hypothetical protein